MPNELTARKKLVELSFTLFIGFFLLVIFGSASFADEVSNQYCRSAREYVTVHEYLLKNQKKYGIESAQATRLAEEVTLGCTGAASRFITTLEVLSKVEVGTKDAIQLSIDLSKKTDEHARVFVDVFKRAFLKKYLDLDLATSLRLAKGVAVNYSGDVKMAGKDFEDVVKFCMKESSMQLPLGQCGQMAQQVAVLGVEYGKTVAASFIETYHFLRSKNGPGLVVGPALQKTLEILSHGPHSSENYEKGFRYAASQSGLDMDVTKAMHFADRMAKAGKSETGKNQNL